MSFPRLRNILYSELSFLFLEGPDAQALVLLSEWTEEFRYGEIATMAAESGIASCHAASGYCVSMNNVYGICEHQVF